MFYDAEAGVQALDLGFHFSDFSFSLLASGSATPPAEAAGLKKAVASPTTWPSGGSNGSRLPLSLPFLLQIRQILLI